MRFYDRVMISNLATTLSQITDQFFTTIQLGASRLIAIKIAHQANSQGNVVQVITVDVTAVDLPTPAIADFDFAVAGRRSVADHEMIGQAVGHSPNVPVVIIEGRCVSLPGAAVVNHNVLPTALSDGCPIDLSPHRSRQVTVTGPAAASASIAKNSFPETSRLLVAILFDR